MATTTELDFGLITPGAPLRVESEMSENGVVFADGIETDFLEFVSGQSVEIRIAPDRLSLVLPKAPPSMRSVTASRSGRARNKPG